MCVKETGEEVEGKGEGGEKRQGKKGGDGVYVSLNFP